MCAGRLHRASGVVTRGSRQSLGLLRRQRGHSSGVWQAGVSYQQLLDLAWKAAAERYLTDAPLSIGEVAYLLGYSEPATFTRAFRRWNDETPQAFRLRQRSEQHRMTRSAASGFA
jgi:AraC-like DNA-binding protein